jgi:thiamine biosynthesis lipoprotein
MERRAFGAMGTEIELLVDADGAARALDAAEAEFHRLEAIMTRFRPESELSQLNASGSIDASPDMLRVVELALDARVRTRGRFDPTVHDMVVAAGYDRSFELIELDGDACTCMDSSLDNHEHRPAGHVRIREGRIELGPGTRLDLGGIGKGYAADRAAELLALAGPCLVNAGGDIAARGGPWPVGVAEEVTVEISDGALATSGRDRRRWRRNGRELHHLIDPPTGAPAESDLLRVTVVADDAVDAEVAAKALFLAGAERATTEADAAGTPAVLVTADGRTILAGGLA